MSARRWIATCDEGLRIANWLRDERLTRCEHAWNGEERPLVCSPCLRDRLLASDWLRERDATITNRARAQAGEDIALAIEAEATTYPHDSIVQIGFRDAARLARDTTKAGGQQARSPVVPSDKSPITGRYT